METQEIEAIIEQLSASSGNDVYVYSGPIDSSTADNLIFQVINNPTPTESAYLILTTGGGDPDAAYRIIRTLKSRHNNVLLYVYGWCKSAGTLIALGADQIIMSDLGELGPLDVQIYRDDDLAGRSSGNDLFQAMQFLNGQAFAMFESTFLGLINKSNGVMTTRTAAEISKNLVIGMLAPIFSQIEPTRLGAISRSISIAMDYGRRLQADQASLQRLIYGYPSHGFVIDRQEASSLFGEKVRAPSPTEAEVGGRLHGLLRHPLQVGYVNLIHYRNVTSPENGSNSTQTSVSDAGEAPSGGDGDRHSTIS